MTTTIEADIRDFYWMLEDGRLWHSGRGAAVPADDEGLVAWSTAVGYEPPRCTPGTVHSLLARRGLAHLAPMTPTIRAEQIKDECARRIFAVLKDQITQLNLTSTASGLLSRKIDGTITAQEGAALDLAEAARGWVTAMRLAARGLILAGDAAYADDAKWPQAPAGVAALVAML